MLQKFCNGYYGGHFFQHPIWLVSSFFLRMTPPRWILTPLVYPTNSSTLWFTTARWPDWWITITGRVVEILSRSSAVGGSFLSTVHHHIQSQWWFDICLLLPGYFLPFFHGRDDISNTLTGSHQGAGKRFAATACSPRKRSMSMASINPGTKFYLQDQPSHDFRLPVSSLPFASGKSNFPSTRMAST